MCVWGGGVWFNSADVLNCDCLEFVLMLFMFPMHMLVTLSGSVAAVRGFLVIAHVPSSPLMLLGQFVVGAGNQQTLNCDAAGVNTQAAIGHSQQINAQSTMFSWTAPSGADGTVDFRY